MSANAIADSKAPGRPDAKGKWDLHLDPLLLTAAVGLLCLGIVMVTSASITIADRNLDSPFYYLFRQGIAIVIGLMGAMTVMRIELEQWEKSGLAMLVLTLFLLVLVLLPAVGKTVNGSTRWIPIGVLNLQVSEVAKLCMILWMSSYLVRHAEAVRNSLWGFLKPVLVLGIVGMLLLKQPDFGAAVVIIATVMVMMFLGGVKLIYYVILTALVAGAGAMLAVSSPYRFARLTSFSDPWADPFDSGFQLTQSLIAIGRGEWFGTGLGGSVQKLFYLPEAHTDFVFAVLAEELGLFGVTVVILLYGLLLWRAFSIGRNAEQLGKPFRAYVAYGIAVWLGLQAFINMGVNMGVLPTKGLTLPLVSYGGSSAIICCLAIAFLLRIHHENVVNGSQTSDRAGQRKANDR